MIFQEEDGDSVGNYSNAKFFLATVVHRVAREGIIGLSPGRQVSVCIGVHVSKEHIFVRTASSSRNTKRITY